MSTEQTAPIKLMSRPRGTRNCCTPVKPVDATPRTREAGLLAALADPTRLGIVELLAGQSEPLCVCDILDNFDLTQPTISHHLRVLRDAGLVTWEKRGLWVYYGLNRQAVGGLAAFLGGL